MEDPSAAPPQSDLVFYPYTSKRLPRRFNPHIPAISYTLGLSIGALQIVETAAITKTASPAVWGITTGLGVIFSQPFIKAHSDWAHTSTIAFSSAYSMWAVHRFRTSQSNKFVTLLSSALGLGTTLYHLYCMQ